jgi:methyl-accepting chemotaxis protein
MRDLTIRAKLFIQLALMILTFGAIAASNYWSAHQAGLAADTLRAGNATGQLLTEAAQAATRVSLAALHAMNATNPAVVTEDARAMATANTALSRAQGELAAGGLSPPNRQAINDTAPLIARLDSSGRSLFNCLIKNEALETLPDHAAAIDHAVSDLRALFGRVNQATQADIAAAEGQLSTAMRHIVLFGMISAALASLILGGFGLLTVRNIVRPIGLLVRCMRTLAAGDTAVTIPDMTARNEIGEMARAVEVFKRSMIDAARLSAQQRRVRRPGRVGTTRWSATLKSLAHRPRPSWGHWPASPRQCGTRPKRWLRHQPKCVRRPRVHPTAPRNRRWN